MYICGGAFSECHPFTVLLNAAILCVVMLSVVAPKINVVFKVSCLRRNVTNATVTTMARCYNTFLVQLPRLSNKLEYLSPQDIFTLLLTGWSLLEWGLITNSLQASFTQMEGDQL